MTLTKPAVLMKPSRNCQLGITTRLFLTYVMPQKDGLQFLKELRKQNNEIPFLLFTGKGREEIAIQALNFGADAYHNKQGNTETVYGELTYGIKQSVERKKAKASVLLNKIQLQLMLDINKMLDASAQELMDYALEAITKTTQSEFAFIDLLNPDETVMTIYSWSKTAMKECKSTLKPIHLPLSEAGIWAEPIRQRKPVILDDYSVHMPHKKGLPEGHVTIKRFLGVPVFEKERIIAVAAVANKKECYDEIDVGKVTALVTDMCRLIQRKITAENLQISEERLKKAEKNAHIGHWEWNIQTSALVWGEENYRIFGLPPQTVPSLENFYCTIHPDDLAFVEQSLEEAWKGKAYNIDMRIIRPDGVERVVNAMGAVEYDMKGKPTQMFGTVQDITERKKAEED